MTSHAKRPSTTCTTPDHHASPRGLFNRNWWMCCSALPANSGSEPKTNETPPRHLAFEFPQLICVLLAVFVAGVLVRRCWMLVMLMYFLFGWCWWLRRRWVVARFGGTVGCEARCCCDACARKKEQVRTNKKGSQTWHRPLKTSCGSCVHV